MNRSDWLPTKAAAEALGVSESTLKRARDSHGGCLEAGKHYSLGLSVNAAITWNVDRCRQAFHQRGLLMRAAQRELASLRQEGK